MQQTLVSVVIPVYGVEQYLDRCVKSVLNQSWDNLEIILVDDESPDHCPEMCDEYEKTDARVRVIHKINGGLTSARKAGFFACNGEYLLFIDSDDYIDASMVERMVTKAMDTQMDITMCAYVRESSASIPALMNYHEDVITRDNLRDLFILPIIRPMAGDVQTNGFMWTKLYRTESIKESYFVSEREYYTEDVMFHIQMALAINGIAIVNEPLYHYCENRESLTFRYREGKFEMWNKRTDYFENYFKENGWEDIAQKRLVVLNLVALMVGADNEVLRGDSQQFKSRCNWMRKSIQERGYLKLCYLKYLNTTQKIITVLFFLKWYRILFLYRERRLKRS